MSSFRIRPRFVHTLDLGLTEARDLIVNTLARSSPGVEVKAFPGYIGLHIVEGDRHFWSPRLALHLEPVADGRTRVEGVYGPNAEVWSFFLFSYLIVGSLGLFSGILGGAQLAIDSSPWGLWVCGAAALVALALYLGAQLGQKLGAWQTFQLHQAYQNAIGRPAEVV
ncbi:MAG: hypothetical protein JNJ82_24165 [Opitutaceae bacterium]|nr:hypothetical protein [Opitutaceae bacterium]